MISASEKAIIFNDCQQVGNLEAVSAGEKDLPPLDLFYDIDTLLDIPIAPKDTQMNEENYDSIYISSASITDDYDGEFD